MRKIILSICFVLLASEVFSTSETGPYISVSELSRTENSGHTVPEILSRLTDFASFTEMTYWSEWRKKERILFEEAKLLSLTPPLPEKIATETIAPRYDFTLFLKDASFGDMEWTGSLTCDGTHILMTMKNSTPVRSLGINAVDPQSLEITLKITIRGSVLEIESRGYAHEKIRLITKERATKSIENRLLAFQNYILKD
ncbi:MAG: DUF6675 family protein [Spirochaetia bacterium]|nr:DUF6675 family protein [Spirochaetia bacterium]